MSSQDAGEVSLRFCRGRPSTRIRLRNDPLFPKRRPAKLGTTEKRTTSAQSTVRNRFPTIRKSFSLLRDRTMKTEFRACGTRARRSCRHCVRVRRKKGSLHLPDAVRRSSRLAQGAVLSAHGARTNGCFSRRWRPIRIRLDAPALLGQPALALRLLLSMLGESLGLHLAPQVRNAIEFFLATPGGPLGRMALFSNASGPRSHRSPNMFTLIGLGTGGAYLTACSYFFFPQIFPASFGHGWGAAPVYFEAAAVITTLVLPGAGPGMRARQRTAVQFARC